MGQELFGFIVFVIVCVVAGIVAVSCSSSKGWRKVGEMLLYFVGVVTIFYVVVAVIGGFFWVLAWIGILLRDILQWIIEAVLLPLFYINPF